MKSEILFFLFLFITGCRHDDSVDPGFVTDKLFAAQLRSSSESVAIGDNNIVLYGSPSRDFSVPMPAGERPLECFARLQDVNGVEIPDNFTLAKVFVINGDEIWTSGFSELRDRNLYDRKALMGNATGGPKWKPGTYVDIVVEFSAAGNTFRILDNAEPIAAPL